ncbi:hypothetical protein [Micrococcus luteus]|uniref:hypothetical protein n=1 Tax=Micrococcus luteus TaxID=1270 RepID=UPI002304A97D|nr:hypothetical protein [Micrococcus luteus]
MSTTAPAAAAQALIVPADPSTPCRLEHYAPGQLETALTDVLDAAMYERTAVLTEGGHYHATLRSHAAAAPLNARVAAHLTALGRGHLARYLRGDIVITGRVQVDGLELLRRDEHRVLPLSTLEDFGVSAPAAA